MRRAQESGGFRRTGCTVGASSASGYGYSASDGTSYQGMGDRRNVTTVRATPTPTRHHHNPGVVVNEPRHPRETVVTTTYRTEPVVVERPRQVVFATPSSPRLLIFSKKDLATKKRGRTRHRTTVTYVTRGSGSGIYCRKCGADMPRDARFCEKCGEAVPGVAPRCPNPDCREHLNPSDRFCPTCGTRC